MGLGSVALCVGGGALALERRAACHAAAAAPAASAAPAAAPAAAPDAPASSGALVLYQYEICPFCNKVKAVLDYFDVPYATVDVNPLTKGQLAFSAYKKVPVLTRGGEGGEQVNDSADILTLLLRQLRHKGALPAGEAAFDSEEAARWARWVDTDLAVYVYPNITRSYGESFEAFGYVNQVPGFSLVDKASNRYLGALAMLLAQGKIKKKYGIVDERAEMYAKLGEWTAALKGRPFHGGDQPNLADLCVFGCLRGIKETATFAQIMSSTDVQPWYQVRAAPAASVCPLRAAAARRRARARATPHAPASDPRGARRARAPAARRGGGRHVVAHAPHVRRARAAARAGRASRRRGRRSARARPADGGISHGSSGDWAEWRVRASASAALGGSRSAELQAAAETIHLPEFEGRHLWRGRRRWCSRAHIIACGPHRRHSLPPRACVHITFSTYHGFAQ